MISIYSGPTMLTADKVDTSVNDVIDALSGMETCEMLRIAGLAIDDRLVDAITTAAELRYVHFEEIVFKDDVLFANVVMLPGITHLSLTNCDISDGTLQALGERTTPLPSLTIQWLDGQRHGMARLPVQRGIRNLTLNGIDFAEGAFDVDCLDQVSLLSLRCTNADANTMACVSKRNDVLLKLAVSGAEIDDAAVAWISKMRMVKDLRLDYTKVSDACISALAEMKQLGYLDVSNTSVSRGGIERIRLELPDADVQQ